MANPSLTAHLLGLSTTNYRRATNSPLLLVVGSREATNEEQSFWLAQDRLYEAHTYPRFIGQLLAKIPSRIMEIPRPKRSIINEFSQFFPVLCQHCQGRNFLPGDLMSTWTRPRLAGGAKRDQYLYDKDHEGGARGFFCRRPRLSSDEDGPLQMVSVEGRVVETSRLRCHR